jgi:hypothetical protein
MRYQVVPLPMKRSGTSEVTGYCPFVVDSERDGLIVAHAIVENQARNSVGYVEQNGHDWLAPTPEAAMQMYAEATPLPEVGNAHPYQSLLRSIPDSTAEAVGES